MPDDEHEDDGEGKGACVVNDAEAACRASRGVCWLRVVVVVGGQRGVVVARRRSTNIIQIRASCPRVTAPLNDKYRLQKLIIKNNKNFF